MDIWEILNIIITKEISFIWNYLQLNNDQRVELIANWVTIIGLSLGLISYWHTIKHDEKMDNEEHIKRSISLIINFNKETLPKLEKLNQEFPKELQNGITKIKKNYPNLSKNDINNMKPTIEKIIKLKKFKLGEIINNVESVGMNVTYHVCDEEILKKDLKPSIAKFYYENENVIKNLESTGHKYENIDNLIIRWRITNERK